MMTTMLRKIGRRIARLAMPLPFRAQHVEYSAISAVDDDAARPNRRLLDVSEGAVAVARKTDLGEVSARMTRPPLYPDVWPGEHYRLLAALTEVLQPRLAIEIGTYQGVGSLSILHSLPAGSELVTVDIVPWEQVYEPALRSSDFQEGRFSQVLGDLGDRAFFDSFKPRIEECDLLFIDGPKDVVFERALLAYLEECRLLEKALVVLDDIRRWNMLAIWREIRRPKMDLTSFGHWSGTGLVDWNGRPDDAEAASA